MSVTDQLERLFLASLTDDDCPSAAQLADYALGVLLGNEQLQVAAHVRGCPFCQQVLAVCTPPHADDLLRVAAEAASSRIRIPIRLARVIPFALAQDRRGAEKRVRQYRSADLIVEVTWTPPDGDMWHLTGRVFRGETPMSDQVISLRARRRRFQTLSDALGFFTFPDIPGGRYTLAVINDGVEVQLRGIILSHDNE